MGDLTPLGLVTTALYILASVLCFARARSAQATREPRLRAFFVAAMAMLLVLGINKQADLQLIVSDIGRNLLHSTGLYDQRSWFQLSLVAVLSLAVLVGTMLLVRLAGNSRAAWTTLVGVALVLAYALVRAISFDVGDLRIYHEDVNVTWILEVSGLVIAILGARTGSEP